MSTVVFQAALGGQINLVGVNTASTFNINVPAIAGNLITSGDSATVTNTMISGPVSEAKGGTGTTTGYYGFKNRIINGQMQIAQRATSATITAGSTIAAGYSTVDRFYVYCTGANVTAAQVTGSGAIKNNLQITGAASVTAIGIGQRIEQLNSYDLAGSTATLSVNISNSLLTTVTWTAYYANTADTFGTLASPTRTQISTGTFTVTSTLTNYSTNISIPAAATTGIEIVFTVGAQTSGTWVIDNIQLEKGSTATSFDYRPYGTELALCQRYYQIVVPNSGTTGSGFANGTTQMWTSTQFKTTMRTSSTITVTGTISAVNVTWSGSSIALTGYTVSTQTTDATSFYGTVASGLTAGQGGFLSMGASNQVVASAEL